MYFRFDDPNNPSLASELIENPDYKDELEHLFSSSPKLKKGCYIEVFNNSLIIKNYFTKTGPAKPPERKANDIRTFSSNSRRRFIKQMAKINLQMYGKPLFVTLTYHNVYPDNSKDLQKQLNYFLTLLRTAKLRYHYVWRLEFQERGAPHFHLILFPLKESNPDKLYIYKNNILKMWRTSLYDWDESMQLFSVDVKMLKGKKHIFQYISKYAAKKDNENILSFSGRRYGFSKNIFIDALLKCEIKLSDFDSLRKIIFNYFVSRGGIDIHFEKYLAHDPTIEVLLTLQETLFILNTFQSISDSTALDTLVLEFSKLDLAA